MWKKVKILFISDKKFIAKHFENRFLKTIQENNDFLKDKTVKEFELGKGLNKTK